MSIRTDGLSIEIRPRKGPDLRIHPASALMLLTLLLSGFVIITTLEVYEVITEGITAEIKPTHILLWASIYFAGAIIHELGHALTYMACGLGWKRLTLSHAISVVPQRRPNRAQQVIISAMGPLAQAAAGCLVIALSQNTPIILIAGIFIVIEGLLNLLMPLGHNSDAVKLYTNLWACIRGRGDEILP